MPYLDRKRRWCGFLDIEEKENSKLFLRRYFVLSHERNILEYYLDNPQNLLRDTKPVGHINMHYVSMISDATKTRPKFPFCFSVTLNGNKLFLRADSDHEKSQWIKILTDAAKIVVMRSKSVVETDSKTIGAQSYKTEVAGGVLIKTPVTAAYDSDSDSSNEMPECDRSIPHSAAPPIRTGYCIKQGAIMKNWKRRYFILNADGIAYYKSPEDISPIRFITKAEVMEARVSIGIHPNKNHLFEIVTLQRVFYIQAESESEMAAWISSINSILPPKMSEDQLATCEVKSFTRPMRHQALEDITINEMDC